MDLRTQIMAALKQAMKDKAVSRLSTLRLISAAIKDKDIDARAAMAANEVVARVPPEQLPARRDRRQPTRHRLRGGGPTAGNRAREHRQG